MIYLLNFFTSRLAQYWQLKKVIGETTALKGDISRKLEKQPKIKKGFFGKPMVCCNCVRVCEIRVLQ